VGFLRATKSLPIKESNVDTIFKSSLGLVANSVAILLFLLVAPFFCILSVLKKRTVDRSIKIVFGSKPIINNKYWSDALSVRGFFSETYVESVYAINSRKDWNIVSSERFYFVPNRYKPLCAFLEGLVRYDVFVVPFSGFFVGSFPILRSMQAALFKAAGAKVIVIPYGADAFVYGRVRSASLTHGLLSSYPRAAREQRAVARQVDYWCRHADVMLPANIGGEGIGRWDALVHSTLAIDLAEWVPRREGPVAHDDEPVRIAHAPNHRGFKGTEFVIEAVRMLQDEGLNVELLLFEGLQNSEVRNNLRDQADILVEQLIYTGYTMSALEGMATGIPVISNMEDEAHLLPFRRWSYLGECPVVSASPENIVDVLRKLVLNRSLRESLGAAGRLYVEKYHGLDSAAFLFGELVELAYGRRDSLMNLYHPLQGAWNHRLPEVRHPLKNNKII
jgi:glycosyltransferase involved in cell wall biosynthesis